MTLCLPVEYIARCYLASFERCGSAATRVIVWDQLLLVDSMHRHLVYWCPQQMEPMHTLWEVLKAALVVVYLAHFFGPSPIESMLVLSGSQISTLWWWERLAEWKICQPQNSHKERMLASSLGSIVWGCLVLLVSVQLILTEQWSRRLLCNPHLCGQWRKTMGGHTWLFCRLHQLMSCSQVLSVATPLDESRCVLV